MAKFYFSKIYSNFIKLSCKMSKSEIVAFLWLTIHADSRGNMVILTAELFTRLIEFVGIKRESMYNVFTSLSKKGLISKHGDLIMVNSQYANKHRMMKVETNPQNWSLQELDF